MNEQLAIYLWSISENIKHCMITTGVISLALTAIINAMIFESKVDNIPYSSYTEEYREEKDKIITSFYKKELIAAALSFLIIATANLIPSKQDLALIFTYPYIKQGAGKAVQSETAKKLHTISTKYLDKIIKDLEVGNNDR